MYEDEERLSKLVADAFLKARKLSSLREKLLRVEPPEEYDEIMNQYENELRGTIKVWEELLNADSRGEYRYLQMAICSIIFDSILYPDTLFPILLIQDKDMWKSLDLHYTETLQLIERFFKRIMGLHVNVSARPDFWNELRIFTDSDRLSNFLLFEVCKRICPDDPDIWHLMSENYKDLAGYVKRKGLPQFERYINLAEEHLVKTLELDPKREAAWSSLAETYFEKGEYDKALECYMKCLELADYKSWPIWEKVAEVHEAKGDFEKALDCMRRAIELNPMPRHYLHLARLLAKLKRRAEALQALNEAEEIRIEKGREHFEWDLRELYRAYIELGEYAKCAEVLGKMTAFAKKDLLMGVQAYLVKQRLEEYHQLMSEMLMKIIKEPMPKQQKRELLEAALEKLMGYID